MVGTVEYYRNYFKTQILNNLVGDNYTLEQLYLRLIEDIKSVNTNQEVYDEFLSNLDKAYKCTYQEIFGEDRQTFGH